MANIDMIDKILDIIENEPERFRMGTFASDVYRYGEICGTTACVAGHAGILAGLVKVTPVRDQFGKLSHHKYTFKNDAIDDAGAWEEAGKEALDIGSRLAELLFYTDDETATRILRRLANGEDEMDIYDSEKEDEEEEPPPYFCDLCDGPCQN